MEFPALILYYTLIGIAVLMLAFLLITDNLIRAAFAFFTVLLIVAVTYVYNGAEIPAVAHLLIYVGGIVVLIILGVMLVKKVSNTTIKNLFTNSVITTVIAFASVTLCTYYLLNSVAVSPSYTNAATEVGLNSVETIGFLFVTEYLLPFELIGWLLLVCLAGAGVIVLKEKSV